jgi:(p)ppGpp synthase/HD superfamily hydrolase
MPPTADQLADLFSHHPPTAFQQLQYDKLRKQAIVMARVIDAQCPTCADRTHAMRLLQSALMFANRSIALQGRSYR